jgi:3-deoxy-D-manno-octulosonate 8-phosphate phosphatase (KDO 8-P phosphatase)
MRSRPSVFIIDVDGVMTDGKFYYDASGKILKVFGPDDHEALLILKNLLPIHFVTADQRGFKITHARIVEDMHFPLDLVTAPMRKAWLQERWNPSQAIYMGDGFMDLPIFQFVGYSIAPANADQSLKAQASFVTARCGGDRAVAEASFHILQEFFQQAKGAAV